VAQVSLHGRLRWPWRPRQSRARTSTTLRPQKVFRVTPKAFA